MSRHVHLETLAQIERDVGAALGSSRGGVVSGPLKTASCEALAALAASTTREEWRAAMGAVSYLWRVTREADYGWYCPPVAALLDGALSRQPSHEIVDAHCGAHPDVCAWGRRVSLSADERAVLSRLTPGPFGGLLHEVASGAAYMAEERIGVELLSEVAS